MDKVLYDCNKAIEHDKLYIKAYRRRANAYESKKMYIEAYNGLICLINIKIVIINVTFIVINLDIILKYIILYIYNNIRV